ncbi:hypothetical protein NW759_004143 [Fusarium solani]|nr:hypothetical protein NW759_004143 [Fusarium solani]
MLYVAGGEGVSCHGASQAEQTRKPVRKRGTSPAGLSRSTDFSAGFCLSSTEPNVQLHDAESRRGVHHAVVKNLALARFGGLAVVCMSKSRLPQIHQPGWA